MEKMNQKALNEKIFVAFKKVLLVNKTELTDKNEKAVKKSIKKIVKKSNEKKAMVLEQQAKIVVSNSPKIKASKQLPN